MAYDEGLAQRIREILEDSTEYKYNEKKMFGGIAFMVRNRMCVGVINDTLMARVGPKNYQKFLKRKYVNEMDFTGKPLKGFLYVENQGIRSDKNLEEWVKICEKFVDSLPPKKK